MNSAGDWAGEVIVKADLKDEDAERQRLELATGAEGGMAKAESFAETLICTKIRQSLRYKLRDHRYAAGDDSVVAGKVADDVIESAVWSNSKELKACMGKDGRAAIVALVAKEIPGIRKEVEQEAAAKQNKSSFAGVNGWMAERPSY